MALKVFLVFLTVSAYVEFLEASPTRRQYIGITEATASDTPVTNDGEVWDDNDEFDLDGEGWLSRSAVWSSPIPKMKSREMSVDYADDYSRVNAMAGFGGEDDDEDEDDEEDEQDHHEQQEAEEMDEDEDGDANDSEFLFSSPKDTRLVLEDDDDEQSGPIKVRHTGRNSYSHSPSEGSENSIESSDEEDEEHPDDFAIDEDDKEGDDDEDDENSVEVLPPRREPLEDDEGEDEFVSEGDEHDDMFENPEEEAAQVIYGDHVFLY